MIKSERYTSKYLNKKKYQLLKKIDWNVRVIKNSISKYCYDNIFELFSDNNFQANYKKFSNQYLDAWQTQTIFQDIIKFYQNTFKQHIFNLDFNIQKEIKITYYKRNTKSGKKVGDIKSFSLIKQKTPLGKLVKYLVFCNLEKLNLKPQIQNLYDYYKNKGYEDRILNLVKSVKQRLKNKIKLIEFSTGTYRKAFNCSNSKDKQGNIHCYNGFIKSQKNTKFKYWFKYKFKNNYVYLPLQINNDYHNFQKIKQGQYFIKINKKKVDIIGTKDVENYIFKDFQNIEGLDLNIKHNFCVLSNNKVFDYDRTYIKEFCKELKKLDKIGTNNFNDNQKKHLNKLVKRNEWYFKKLISQLLDYIQENNITDLVMEDLQSFSKTFVYNEEFQIKYSRLVRLLRLNNISKWIKQQSQKRGIRIHLTSSCYTSQTCPKCKNVDRENRKNQEQFCCQHCGYTANADYNASINIRQRYISNVLKQKLHLFDQFGRLIPRKLKKEKIKQIILDLS